MKKDAKKDASFVVRLTKEDLEKLNELVKKNATNRSELFRQWVKKYIREEKQMEKENFLKVANGKYTVDGYTIQYSDAPNYEWCAVVNGEFVDVSEYEWNDFDGFIEAVIMEYQK